MRRRFALAVFAPLALLVAPAGPLAAQGARRPPNIVYVLADELGYYELSCMGHPSIRTPHIDRMAAEGVRFTQYLAGSAVCAPTRACLMTGKHSGHTSVRSNGGGTPLRAEEVTVASLLKQRGYATGGFGKWGCGGRGSTGVPERHGFDEFVGYYDQVHAHSYYPPYILENSEELPLPGNEGGSTGATYSHYVIVDRARQFIRAHKDEPFFCYLPITPPHGLFDIPDEDPAWALYADKAWPEPARRYAAMVSMVDRQMGELFELLKELALDDDTLVIFSGDNGGADYFASEEHPRGLHGANVDPRTGVEFRGKKGQLYEGGLRVPMIARWPGRIAAGAVSDHLCYFPDLMPTLAELSGAEAPADLDGVSILPTLIGAEAAGGAQRQAPFLYWEIGGQTALRRGDWKLVRSKPAEAWQLYDLARDISERHDVAAANEALTAELAALARAAHEPVREGTFERRDLHERDRRAKLGDPAPERPARSGEVERMPRAGLLANEGWRVHRASSESTFNGKLAALAIDGDPETFWHTAWRDGLVKPPHELVLDLGATVTIRGFRYLARQDNGWNGSLGECEFAVSDDPEAFAEAALTTTFTKTKQAQSVECAPQKGRYVRLRALSEVNGGAWASIAELGVIGER